MFTQGKVGAKEQSGSLPVISSGRTYYGKPGSFQVNYNPLISEGFYSDKVYVSVGHPAPYRRGGPFCVEHKKDMVKVNRLNGLATTGMTLDNVPVYSNTFPSTFSLASVDISTTAFAAGATGIARYRPGTSEMGLGQAFAEARQVPQLPGDLLARLLKSKGAVGALKGTGDEFLNIQFGWKPLLQDLRDLLHVRQKLQKSLAQLRRDNGTFVRRRGTISRLVSSSSTEFTAQIVPTALVMASGPAVLTSLSEDVYSFSGRFRYFIPDSILNDPPPSLYAVLAGTRITPELAWNLTPWSWLVDWFSNFGSLMTNISDNAAGNVVMDYGYVMGRRIRRSETHVPWRTVPNLGYTASGTCGVVKENSVKSRYGAYPYAFGPTPPGLSYGQAAVLGALGLSNHPRF